jgi:hypothetical protein
MAGRGSATRPTGLLPAHPRRQIADSLAIATVQRLLAEAGVDMSALVDAAGTASRSSVA